MKQAGRAAMALLGSVALAVSFSQALHAQPKQKPAYLVAEIQVTNPAGYKAYLTKALDSLKPYHARIMARGMPAVVEGTPAQGNVLVIEFPSMAEAEKWYTTPPYKDLITRRQKSAKSRLYFIDGM